MWSFAYRDFNYLVSSEFLEFVKAYLDKTEKYIKVSNYRFLIVPNDTDFFLDFI